MLVGAFAGKDRILRAYRHAIEKRTFFSYGRDAHRKMISG